MRNNNRKGNAALAALLVVIIIIGIGASVMILAGRNEIDETAKYEQDKNTSNVQQATTQAVQTQPEQTVVDVYSKKSADFKQTSIADFSAQASELVDLDSNEILAGNNLDQRVYPASLTKIMTILVACENINSYDDTYTFKESDFVDIINQDGSMAGFKAGETVTARDLLYGAILPSGADACIGLANLAAGSEKEFVKLMNQRVKEIGLKNTNFTNCWGIHDKNHYSSVNDISVIMKLAYNNVTCRNVLSTFEYTTAATQQNPEGIELICVLGGRLQGFFIDKNGNGEDDDTAKIIGGKTGFTDEAGSCLATFCQDSQTGHIYVCVLVRCSSTEKSVIDSMTMYEKYLPGSTASIPDATATTTAAQQTTTTNAA